MNEDAIKRKLVYAFLFGLISDDVERKKALEYIDELPPVNPTKTGWIPVSERLPEICEEDCYGNITFSKTVLTTQIYGDGYVHVGIDKYTTNNGGGWLMEVPFDNPEECCEVIAWMPLPKPYEPQERSDKK